MHYNFKPNSIIHKDTLKNFSGEWISDAEFEHYEKNKDKIDPYYHQTPVAYRYNSQGYRTKEFGDINREFLLALGCSHTEGTALPEKDIWCSVLADSMEMDLINLGASGQGLEFICYNSELYIKNNFPLPKVVVIQHPERARRVYAKKLNRCDHNNNDIVDLTIKVDDDLTRIEEADHISNNIYTTVFKSAMLTNLVTRIWNSVGVPVYHWTFNTDGEDWLSDYCVFEVPHDVDQSQYHYEMDHARDLTHHGYRNHRCVAAILEDNIRGMLESNSLNVRANHPRTKQYANDSLEYDISAEMKRVILQENHMSEEHNEHETHEGSLGTDRNPPSGTEEQEREAELKRRIEELRKRDPFIYR